MKGDHNLLAFLMVWERWHWHKAITIQDERSPSWCSIVTCMCKLLPYITSKSLQTSYYVQKNLCVDGGLTSVEMENEAK
jgi:hypothetical protein